MHGGLDLLHWAPQLAADLRVAVHLQVLEVLADQRPLELEVVPFGGFRVVFQRAELKEKALARTRPLNSRTGRYQPPDSLLAWLEAL